MASKPPAPRMTRPTQAVLHALLAESSREFYGLELGTITGLPSGTIHPILTRLKAHGWLESRWEETDPRGQGRPRRRYYSLTPSGAVHARAALARADATSARLARPQPPKGPTVSTELPVPEHLDLGKLIAALEAEDPAKILKLGFNNPHSYRGYYDDLAFEPAANITVGAMLAAAREALGATYLGCKGSGEYTMTGWSDVWLASDGHTGESLGRVLLSFLLTNVATLDLVRETSQP